MNYMELPQTDLIVLRLALGNMRIASKTVDEVDALITKVLDLGINFFDHADIYGAGKSEELFGEVLKRHPANMQPILGTTSPVHLEEMSKACDFTLTRQEWYDLYLASEKPLP